MQAAGASCTTVYGQIATNPDLKTLKVAVDAAGLQGKRIDLRCDVREKCVHGPFSPCGATKDDFAIAVPSVQHALSL